MTILSQDVPVLPNVGDTVQQVAGVAGNQLIGAITNTIPFVLPVLAVLWGIRFALKKIKF